MNDIEEPTMAAEQMKKTMLDGLREKHWDRAYKFVDRLEDSVDIKCAYGDYTDYGDTSEIVLMQFFVEES